MTYEASTGRFQDPAGLAVGAPGNLYVAEVEFHNGPAQLHRVIGLRKGTGAEHFGDPEDLAFDGDGGLLVADGGNHRIQLLTWDGRPIREIRQALAELGEPTAPLGAQ